MNRLVRGVFSPSLLVVVAILALACSQQETRVPFDTDEHLGAWVNLWNTYDLNLVDDLFVTDSSVTYFSSEYEGVIKGIEAVREHHVGFGFFEGGKAAEQELWVADIDAVEHWPTVIVTGIWFFGDRSRPPEEVQRGPFTFVYVQQEGTYRLAHLNFGNYENATDEDEG